MGNLDLSQFWNYVMRVRRFGYEFQGAIILRIFQVKGSRNQNVYSMKVASPSRPQDIFIRQCPLKGIGRFWLFKCGGIFSSAGAD